MIKKIFVEATCLLVVVLFIYTGLSKYIDFREFRAAVGKSPMLSDISNVVALTIPALELLIALLLIIPRYRTIGLYGAYSLMVMFTTYIFIMLYFSSYRACTCGGIIQKMSWNTHLYFNAVISLMLLTSLLMQSKLYRKRANHEYKSLLQ